MINFTWEMRNSRVSDDLIIVCWSRNVSKSCRTSCVPHKSSTKCIEIYLCTIAKTDKVQKSELFLAIFWSKKWNQMSCLFMSTFIPFLSRRWSHSTEPVKMHGSLTGLDPNTLERWKGDSRPKGRRLIGREEERGRVTDQSATVVGNKFHYWF